MEKDYNKLLKLANIVLIECCINEQLVFLFALHGSLTNDDIILEKIECLLKCWWIFNVKYKINAEQ